MQFYHTCGSCDSDKCSSNNRAKCITFAIVCWDQNSNRNNDETTGKIISWINYPWKNIRQEKT
ncbi:hypothetical protein T06_11420 [Trichinella sp. T6]|nr:hypothetical protein T06_11420 [Trichinella sp. T6]